MPNYYNPYLYQNYANPYPQNYPQQIQQQPQQKHDGGFISVRSEQEARNYPVAPATIVTFKNENEPYIYTKTVNNPMEAPIFEKFKLVKEDSETEQIPTTPYAEKGEFEALKADFENFKKELISNVPTSTNNANTSAV